MIIDIEYELYKEMKIGENFTLLFYNVVDIPIKGIYQGQDVKVNSQKWQKE